MFIALATAFALGVAIEIGCVALRRAGAGRGWLALGVLAIALVPVVPVVGALAGAPLRVTIAALALPSSPPVSSGRGGRGGTDR